MTRIELTIQVLTCSALVGLLAATGLRLTLKEVTQALVRCPFVTIVVVNFAVIPAVVTGIALLFALRAEVAIGMVLLAAAPFAPVVPVFARMARADLALAAALTGIFPLISAVLTPLAARAALWVLARHSEIHFDLWSSLGLLIVTITLPLILGVLIRHAAPQFAKQLLKPVEVISETVGAISLAFVTVTQFELITGLGARAWIAMALVSELSLVIGWRFGGPNRTGRQVVALGTSNRNIALALLIAVQSFSGTAIASVVAGNGLVLIALGLVHVAWWRWSGSNAST